MIRRKIYTPFLAIGLAVMMFVTACNTSWINTALADLPVIIQIATNIAAIVGTAQGQANEHASDGRNSGCRSYGEDGPSGYSGAG